MELRNYASIAKRWWLALLLAAWAGGLIGYVATLVLPATYEGRTQFLVGPIDATFTVQRAAGNLARTYADLAVSQDLLAGIVADHPALDEEMLEEQIRTTASEATRLVTVIVQQPTAELAALGANAIVERLIQLTDTPSPEGEITVIDVAEIPEEPVGPSIILVVAMAAAAGAVAVLFLLLIWESVSSVVRDADEAAELSGIPILAVLRRVRVDAEPANGQSAVLLLTARFGHDSDRADGPIAFVGASGSGTSAAWTAAVVASNLARSGRAVTLVDEADGAAARILTHASASDAIPPGFVADVHLGEGRPLRLVTPQNGEVPSDTLTSRERSVLVTAESVEGTRMAPWVSGHRAVIVATADETGRAELVRTASALQLFGARLIGVVVVENAMGIVARLRWRPRPVWGESTLQEGIQENRSTPAPVDQRPQSASGRSRRYRRTAHLRKDP